MDGLGLERWSTGVARRLRRLALEPLYCGCLEPVGLEGSGGLFHDLWRTGRVDSLLVHVSMRS